MFTISVNTFLENLTGDFKFLQLFRKTINIFTWLSFVRLEDPRVTESFLVLFVLDTRLTKAWTAINRLSVIWKSDLTDKMKCSFFQAAIESILLYGCTTWTLTKRMEKKTLTATAQECCEQYWTSPGGNTLQSSSYTATYHLLRKLSKLDEPDMRDTAGEVGTGS